MLPSGRESPGGDDGAAAYGRCGSGTEQHDVADRIGTVDELVHCASRRKPADPGIGYRAPQRVDDTVP